MQRVFVERALGLMMIIGRIRLLLEKIVKRDCSPKRLAITFCLGVYIGLSPFIGLRTLITFICGWLFALDLAVLFSVSFFVHNPWTIIPIYTLNHFLGQCLLNFFNIDGMQFDPAWAGSCSLFLKEYTGISGLSFSAFLVGGNVLGICMSIILYPFVKRMFSSYLSKKNNNHLHKGMQR
jgi:uncharacterized protein (DUF2062 family)